MSPDASLIFTAGLCTELIVIFIRAFMQYVLPGFILQLFNEPPDHQIGEWEHPWKERMLISLVQTISGARQLEGITGQRPPWFLVSRCGATVVWGVPGDEFCRSPPSLPIFILPTSRFTIPETAICRLIIGHWSIVWEASSHAPRLQALCDSVNCL